MPTQKSPGTFINSKLSFNKETPYSESGFGVFQNVYSSGRIGVAINFFGGINKLEHWGVSPMYLPHVIFKGEPTSSYTRCFRAQVEVDGDPYNLEFSSTTHYPFGYKSHFSVPERGVKLLHRLTLLNDALVFSIEVLQNKNHLSLRQRFELHDHTFNEAPGRNRTAWETGVIPTGWVMTVKDVVPDDKWEKLQAEIMTKPNNVADFPILTQGARKGTQWIALLNEHGLAMKCRHSFRRDFTGEAFRRGEHASVLLFASSVDEGILRVEELRKKAVVLVKKKERDYQRELTEDPKFETGDKVFDSMLAMVPPTLKSLMVDDIPGAQRGASFSYWVWGWDILACADVYMLSRQFDFARNALRFYRDTADPEWGVGHQFTMDKPPRVRLPMAFSAQMLYTIFLYQYGVYTGNLSLWRECYPLIKQIFESSLKAINDYGLGRGAALYPDTPDLCGHTGNDISVFNNSIQYQGLRCLGEIAIVCGDQMTAERAQQICRLMEQQFVASFWDKKREYFVDSIDSETGEQRLTYPSHALLWLTPFLSDLVSADKLEKCASFIAENLATARGFLMYPRWDTSFDVDENQTGSIWATPDMFVARCQAMAGRQDVLEKWIKASDWFWKDLTYHEGHSAHTINDSGTLDWHGKKMSFFSTKTTYMAFLNGCAGIHFDNGGVTLSEGLARPLHISQLPFQKATLDLNLKGKGKFIRKLLVNGKSLMGSLKIPIHLLKGKVKIVFERTEKAPLHPVLRSLYGAEIRKVTIDNTGRLEAVVFGHTPVWLQYYSRKPARIMFNGRELSGEYDAKRREGKVLLPLSSLSATIEIKP